MAMTYQLERRAAEMRLRNANHLYRRAASSPTNKRAKVAAFNRQVNQDRKLLGPDLPKRLPKFARPVETQAELFDDRIERIAC